MDTILSLAGFAMVFMVTLLTLMLIASSALAGKRQISAPANATLIAAVLAAAAMVAYVLAFGHHTFILE